MKINTGTLYQGYENNLKMFSGLVNAIDETYNGDPEKYKTLNRFSGSELEKVAFCTLLGNAANMAGRARQVVDESGVQDAGLSTMNVIKNIETTLFELFTGTAANMLSYRVVAVQPITSPSAYVYYFDFKYGKTKGNIAGGTPLLSHISSLTKGYAGSKVWGEKVANSASSHQIAYLPVIPGTITVTNGTAIAKDDGKGKFAGAAWASELSVDYATGIITIGTYETVDSEGDKVAINYQYDTELATPAPIQAELVSVPVTAEVKTLKATSTLVAVLNSKAVLGVDLSAVTLEVATRELAAEFDFDIFGDLLEGASTTMTVEGFDKTVEEYDSFQRRYAQVISDASNAIFNATQKLEASFMICGTDHASIIENNNKFIAIDNSENLSSGPRYMGKLNGKDIIKVPSSVYPPNAAVIGAKSNIPVIGAGYIFAPYIMAFPSQLISDADLRVSQGYVSIAGKKMVNADLYVRLNLV